MRLDVSDRNRHLFRQLKWDACLWFTVDDQNATVHVSHFTFRYRRLRSDSH